MEIGEQHPRVFLSSVGMAVHLQQGEEGGNIQGAFIVSLFWQKGGVLYGERWNGTSPAETLERRKRIPSGGECAMRGIIDKLSVFIILARREAEEAVTGRGEGGRQGCHIDITRHVLLIQGYQFDVKSCVYPRCMQRHVT